MRQTTTYDIFMFPLSSGIQIRRIYFQYWEENKVKGALTFIKFRMSVSAFEFLDDIDFGRDENISLTLTVNQYKTSVGDRP